MLAQELKEEDPYRVKIKSLEAMLTSKNFLESGFSTLSAAKYQVFEYIEVYYNRKRLHSTLGYASLKAFDAKKVA